MVKSDKGITLLSLIIYIVLLTFVLSMLAIVSNMFYSSTDYVINKGKYIYEFNKFNMYFIEDVKSNSQIYSINDKEIVFEDGTTYTYSNKGIYRNKVKICNNVLNCTFSNSELQVENTTKQIIKVTLIVEGSKSFTTENEYVLKYW